MPNLASVVRVDCYVALGSSSTLGAGASDPDTHGYVALLEKGLVERFPGLETQNLGRAKARLSEILERWDEVEAARPSLITLLPFTDYARTPAAQLETDITELVRRVQSLASARILEGGHCHVFVGDLRIDPTYVRGANDDTSGPQYRLKDYEMLSEKNEVVARAVASSDAITVVPVIDQNAIHPEWIGPDGHPNDLGHGYLAGCFRNAIDSWIDGAAGA